MRGWWARLYHWWIYAHVFAVFLFLLTHGLSIGIAFMVRGERDPSRLKPLLELSYYSVGAIHMSMFLVLGTGIVLGFMGNWWGSPWLWASVILFLAMWGAMAGLGTIHQDRLRLALGLKPFYGKFAKKGALLPPPAPNEELERLLRSPRAHVLAALGIVALAAFLWLMMFKPF